MLQQCYEESRKPVGLAIRHSPMRMRLGVLKTSGSTLGGGASVLRFMVLIMWNTDTKKKKQTSSVVQSSLLLAMPLTKHVVTKTSQHGRHFGPIIIVITILAIKHCCNPPVRFAVIPPLTYLRPSAHSFLYKVKRPNSSIALLMTKSEDGL